MVGLNPPMPSLHISVGWDPQREERGRDGQAAWMACVGGAARGVVGLQEALDKALAGCDMAFRLDEDKRAVSAAWHGMA